MHADDDALLTTKEVADKLRVHVKTVQEWIAKGELAAIDLGQGYRITKSDLDAFLEKRRRRRTERRKGEV